MSILNTVIHLRLCQTSILELFSEIFNYINSFTIFTQKLHRRCLTGSLLQICLSEFFSKSIRCFKHHACEHLLLLSEKQCNSSSLVRRPPFSSKKKLCLNKLSQSRSNVIVDQSICWKQMKRCSNTFLFALGSFVITRLIKLEYIYGCKLAEVYLQKICQKNYVIFS